MADQPFTLATRTDADPDLKREQFLATFKAGMPEGFQVIIGSPLWSLADSVGEIAADLETVALVDRMAEYAEGLGTYIFGLPRLTASPAGGTSTWLVSGVGSGGADIPAGTPVRVGGVNFTVSDTVHVPEGAEYVEDVPLVCNTAGTVGDGFTGPLEILAAFRFVLGADLDAPTGGGTDGETSASYLIRFAEELQHIGRPTLPEDFAAKLRRIPGIYRVLAIPNYVPGDTPQTNVGRAIALWTMDQSGNDPSEPALEAGRVLLELQREWGWTVNVLTPTRMTINTAASFTTWPGYDPAEVAVRAEAALRSFYNPGTWGAPPSGEIPVWHDEPIVYRSEVSAALNNVQGLRRVPADTLLLNGLAEDIALPQPAGLPQAGTITLTPIDGP